MVEVKEEIKEVKTEEKEIKWEFKELYTAREYLSQHKAEHRNLIYDEIPAIIKSLKSGITQDEILELDVKIFMSLMEAYQIRCGLTTKRVDFLEQK